MHLRIIILGLKRKVALRVDWFGDTIKVISSIFITISSIGSRRVLPEYSVVGVSKAAIEAVTRYLAIELAPLGIIANCISPGIVLTEALDHFPSKETLIRTAQNATPVGRLVTPADVGALAAWLCSDAAGMIVGQTIEMDGGHSLLMSG